jgi:hypothetical protein
MVILIIYACSLTNDLVVSVACVVYLSICLFLSLFFFSAGIVLIPLVVIGIIYV